MSLVKPDADAMQLEELEEPAIAAESLTVTCGKEDVVRDLSLHVPPGAIYGLIGPSGAGKSTVLRVLATVQRPDAGTARIDGFDLLTNPVAIRARIGYLPDFAGVYEAYTLREYLAFYGALYGLPARQRRRAADELLELFGLEKWRDRAVRTLSRGMRQQLSVARCLLHDPSVLLLDEPAAGMDPQARLDLYEILRELSRLGKTVVISSHLLSDLTGVCTHFGVMKGGQLLVEGEVMELAPDRQDIEDVYLQLIGDEVEGQGV